MNYKLLLSILFFTTINGLSAQSDSVKLKNGTPESISKKTKTLKISTQNLSEKTLGELKDELIVWKEKVISININEQTKEFILEHNYLLSDQELFEVLRKYEIQKKHIISYK